MTLRQLLHLTVLTLLLGLAVATVLPIATAAYQPYPPMAPGQSPGSVIGKVTDARGNGIAGASVTLASATDGSILYASGLTGSDGYYLFSGVNSSGGKSAYRVYANATGYEVTSSGLLAVESGGTCNVATLTLTGPGPAQAPTPAPIQKPGNISGYVTAAGTGEPLANATVTLVDAPDMFTIYDTTRTRTDGSYCLSGVKALSAPGYRLRVEQASCGEAYSLPFTVNQGAAVKINVTLNVSASAFVNAAISAVGNDSGNLAGAGIRVTPVPLPSPSEKAGPGFPGLEAIAALTGIAIVCAVIRKQ